jgi:hypothetical protein
LARASWTAIPDSETRFSTGVPDFDRLLGGGFRRGSMALFSFDETVEPLDRELLFTPILLNFLYHSRGVIAVLPSRESPHSFRTHLTRWATRRRFDARVRVIDYAQEASEAPYVVHLRASASVENVARVRRARRAKDMAKMNTVETAVRGARSRMFLEMVAFEIAEMLFGADTATRMFFHGIKRTRSVGNLCLGVLRPGLGCSSAVRAMADVELSVHRGEGGLMIRGTRPSFPSHLVTVNEERGEPYLSLRPVG